MKWIVVILVLLNLSAWLLGKRIDPGVKQNLRAEQAETINAAGMRVIEPAEEMEMRKKNEIIALEEEKIAQLKLDERGKVLMAPPSATNKDDASSERNPTVKTTKPVKIVAFDRSKSEAPAAPAQKHAELEEAAASEPVLTPAPAPEPAPEPAPIAAPFFVLYFAQSNKLKQRLIVDESSRNIFDLILNFRCLNPACCPK